jgi:dihydroorotate dehydrogenase electron transfer subunit
MSAYTAAHRGSIFVEDATVLSHQHLAANQHVLRLQAPRLAAGARPGSFVHLQCDASLLMRRPMSLMRVEAGTGWIDILYKVHGHGTDLLARRQPGETLSVIGPIGQPFKLKGYRRRPLLMGGGVGIPPMLFLAEHMKQLGFANPLVIIGSEVPFPFTAKPSAIMVPGMPDGVIASMPLLEDWRVPSRLASLQGYPGCYEGYVTDLARSWLDCVGADPAARAEIEIFACGPTPMLKAVRALAVEYGLPCQISLEEYMACAVGGCAGCVVRIETENGPAMKRVCVDGPVFEAASVVFS